MLHTGEVAEALADLFFLDTCDVGCNTGCQRVVDIMFTSETETLLFHVEWLRLFNLILAFLDIADDTFLLQLREGVLYGLNVVFLQFPFDDGIVGPVDEGIFGCLVLDDSHLGVHIVLHLEVVAVQMVGGDVQQDGDVGTEVVHVVQLE